MALLIPKHLRVVPGALAITLFSRLNAETVVIHLWRELVVFPACLLVVLTTKARIG
ncbi:hypothetical protein L1D31_21535 [Vibrio sp. Isolate23]|uniref:hypothetical protein n=1 Tax=Vibrio sp. Isolate23 TaxID=2908533 RepID=UPI001EFD5BDB|nr:hypothetical protein [Vibrio sp. Isolate23]MCG9685107.1 hypothetical protein [Vibrio sp. Isolate23]